jgi:hypothetical protein
MPDKYEIMLDPQRHGYMECPHYNGYESSLKDLEGVDTCTMCNGWGLIREEKNKTYLKSSDSQRNRSKREPRAKSENRSHTIVDPRYQ